MPIKTKIKMLKKAQTKKLVVAAAGFLAMLGTQVAHADDCVRNESTGLCDIGGYTVVVSGDDGTIDTSDDGGCHAENSNCGGGDQDGDGDGDDNGGGGDDGGGIEPDPTPTPPPTPTATPTPLGARERTLGKSCACVTFGSDYCRLFEQRNTCVRNMTAYPNCNDIVRNFGFAMTNAAASVEAALGLLNITTPPRDMRGGNPFTLTPITNEQGVVIGYNLVLYPAFFQINNQTLADVLPADVIRNLPTNEAQTLFFNTFIAAALGATANPNDVIRACNSQQVSQDQAASTPQQ